MIFLPFQMLIYSYNLLERNGYGIHTETETEMRATRVTVHTKCICKRCIYFAFSDFFPGAVSFSFFLFIFSGLNRLFTITELIYMDAGARLYIHTKSTIKIQLESHLIMHIRNYLFTISASQL